MLAKVFFKREQTDTKSIVAVELSISCLFFIIEYSDKNGKRYRIEQEFHIDWRSCQFEESSHAMRNANYHIVDGLYLESGVFEEYRNLKRSYRVEKGLSSISDN
ncbi:hypothetical protein OfM1_16160 [Lactovum odontotermitis]